MLDNSSNNKRIAKNTIVLYLRMLFILCVGLFTSRVVLNTLGVEDYGLYNVVGGFTVFFTFLNGAITNATQRFITFELARGDVERQRVTFSTALITHISMALVIVILAETIGLWFVHNKMVIPESRFVAAVWVYHLAVASLFISIISLPYNALIIAHEKMSAFAYISILDVVLKLVVVYLLVISPWDRLIIYATLLFLVSLLDRVIYTAYCGKHFQETKINWVFDRNIFKEMANIAGWSLFGNMAGVCYTQGLNVLLNMFFGPTVNAARGIAVTVQGVVTGFVTNFQMALNPQITKSYAVGDLDRMHKLIFTSSKFSFFLLFLITLPIIIEAYPILLIWLKIVPEHTVWFLRLILCILLIETLANPMMVSSQSVGKVKVYQSVVGGLLLLILPIAYFVLKGGGNPESVFIVHFCIAILAQGCRVYIVGRMIKMSLRLYLKEVILPVTSVFLLATSLSVASYKILLPSLLSAVFIIVLTVMFTSASILLVGLRSDERRLILDKVHTIRHKG